MSSPAHMGVAVLRLLPLLALIFATVPVQADVLKDLRAVLVPAQFPALKGQLQVSTHNREGSGKDLVVTAGEARVGVESGSEGLHIVWPRAALQRLQAEERAKAADPQAKSPLLDAMEALQPKDVLDLLEPGNSFARMLDRATLRGDRTEDWQGKPARHIRLDLAREPTAGPDADFVKRYEGSLEVWLGEDGRPLAAHKHEVFAGRAFLVLSFEVVQDEDLRFGDFDQRWVVLQSVTHVHNSGTVGNRDRDTSLSLLPAE